MKDPKKSPETVEYFTIHFDDSPPEEIVLDINRMYLFDNSAIANIYNQYPTTLSIASHSLEATNKVFKLLKNICEEPLKHVQGNYPLLAKYILSLENQTLSLRFDMTKYDSQRLFDYFLKETNKNTHQNEFFNDIEDFIVFSKHYVVSISKNSFKKSLLVC